jgi:outer membrane biogenesis lipoprotein LolB
MRAPGALCAAVAIVAGCAHAPPPAIDLERVPIDEARRAIERIGHQGGERTSLRAVGRLRLVTPDGDGHVREIILAQRPDRLRLESHGPLGQALGLLVTDGGQYAFFDGEQLERGAVRDDLLERRLGMELRLEEAVELLLAAPAVGGEVLAAFRRDSETLVDGEGWHLAYDALGDLARVEARERDGAVRWRAIYQGWEEAPGGRFPRELYLEFPATRVRAELTLSRVELNPQLGPAQFSAPGARP